MFSHTFTFGACIFFPLSLSIHTPDDSLDAEDSDQRTHFPQFSYSASIREWSLRQLNNQANTQSQSHIYSCPAGVLNDTQTKTGTRHNFHLVFNAHTLTDTHIHMHWQIRQDRDDGVWNEHTGCEWLTSAGLCGQTWQLCLCTSSQVWLSAFLQDPCCSTLGTTSKPWPFVNQVMPASTTSLPAVPLLDKQIQTHQPMHCLHMYTQTYFMNFEKYNQKLEKIKMVSSIVTVLNVKPYFCIFCNYFF